MEPNLHQQRDLVAAQFTKLRVVQNKGRKAALMLEQIFWSALDELAKEKNLSTAKMVFSIFDSNRETSNRTGLLRCFCLEQLRTKVSAARSHSEAFDMLGIIAACPTPAAVVTPQHRISAFNPAFNVLINALRSRDIQGNAIRFSFSEAVPKILRALLDEPRHIPLHHVGIQIGDGKPHFFATRFALADRKQGIESQMILFFEAQRIEAKT